METCPACSLSWLPCLSFCEYLTNFSAYPLVFSSSSYCASFQPTPAVLSTCPANATSAPLLCVHCWHAGICNAILNTFTSKVWDVTSISLGWGELSQIPVRKNRQDLMNLSYFPFWILICYTNLLALFCPDVSVNKGFVLTMAVALRPYILSYSS